jgi:hypothetical protein
LQSEPKPLCYLRFLLLIECCDRFASGEAKLFTTCGIVRAAHCGIGVSPSFGEVSQEDVSISGRQPIESVIREFVIGRGGRRALLVIG